MTQQQLLIFLRVHKTRSFAKAAQQLGIAQSTVSREIALLEREFQAPLFIRHSTGITPTPAGTALSTHATSFRDLYPKMLEDCRRIDAGLLPSLSLGTNSSGAVIMQPVLDRIVQEHPDVPLSLQNAKFYYLLRMLNTGDVDAGVLLVGARGDADLILLEDYQAQGTEVRVATNDGSVGTKGFVTVLLEDLLKNSEPGKKYRFYACGPTPMLMTAGKMLCDAGREDGELSLDHVMCCGVGACFACVVKVKDGDSFRYARSCSEGPVFTAGEVYYEN